MNNSNHIHFFQDRKPVQLNNEEVLFIKAARDYVRLITPGKKYITHSTIKAMESRVNTDILIRVHRCFIVNIRKATIIDERAVLIGDDVIPISKTYRTAFFQRIAS